MKKITVLLMVLLVMLSAVFAGGGQESDTANPDETVIRVSWWGNQLRNDVTQQAIDLYMEQNPGIRIESEFTDWSSYWDRLATQAAGDGLPDVIQMDYSYLLQYVESNQLADLSGYLEDGTIDHSKIADSVIASGSVGDGTYAISLGNTAPMMVYDLGVVEEAGVEIPLNPTVSEFYDICQEIYEKTGVPMFWESGMNMILYVARANGSEIFSELKEGIADSTAIHMDLVEKFANADFHVSPELLAEKNVLVVDQMPINDLTTWNQFTVSNGYSALSVACGGRPMGVCTYPKLDNAVQEPVYVKPTMFFSVAESSPNKDEAAKFIDWFVNSSEANAILNGERGVPVNSDVSAEVSANVSEADAVAYQYLDDIMSFANPVDPPNPPGFAEVEAALLTYVDNIRYGNMTAEEATALFVPEAQQILQNASN